MRPTVLACLLVLVTSSVAGCRRRARPEPPQEETGETADLLGPLTISRRFATAAELARFLVEERRFSAADAAEIARAFAGPTRLAATREPVPAARLGGAGASFWVAGRIESGAPRATLPAGDPTTCLEMAPISEGSELVAGDAAPFLAPGRARGQTVGQKSDRVRQYLALEAPGFAVRDVRAGGAGPDPGCGTLVELAASAPAGRLWLGITGTTDRARDDHPASQLLVPARPPPPATTEAAAPAAVPPRSEPPRIAEARVPDAGAPQPTPEMLRASMSRQLLRRAAGLQGGFLRGLPLGLPPAQPRPRPATLRPATPAATAP